ncbi:MAG TPA: Spy/CpxP family protein refolding chaperone [Polyangia bacterium]|jgi:Spy/CpxP family protein refolding chaperone
MRPFPLAAAVLALAAPVAHAAPSVRQAHVATLATELRLDDAAAERMQSTIDKYNARMKPLQRADRELLGALHTQLALSAPDAQRMKSLAADLVKNRGKLQSLRDDRLHDLQKTLTPEQFSRLLLRWPALTQKFRRQARAMVR